LDLRLSYSAISAYEKCPLSYRFQYIDRLEIEPSPYLSFGRSLHSVLQWLYARKVPEPPSLDDLLLQLDVCWESDGYCEQGEEDSFREHAREVLTAYYGKNAREFRLPVAIEERFEMKMDGYVLSGVIDRIDRREDGAYEIIDYKTNRKLPELRRLRDDLQLPIYQMACHETWGISPSKLTFYYLIPNQKYSTKPKDSEGLAQVRERLDRVAEFVRDRQFPATPNPLCPWCSFQDACPEKAKGDSLEARYLSRHRWLIEKKDALLAAISELEEEMVDQGIDLSYDSPAGTIRDGSD
jgi:putative RecB family exonuclease